MWSEKRSLREFLFIYLSSTLLLIFIGSYFYYQVKKDSIIDNTINLLEKDIDRFILANKDKHYLKTGKKPNFLNLKIAIYINGKFKTGNLKDKSIDLSKSYFIKSGKLYFIKKEYKNKWGKIAFVTYKNIESKIFNLKKQIALFLLFVFIFITLTAYILGKILLKPIKHSIQNLEEFIKDSTHEINTPISNILINIELIKELYPNLKEIEEFDKIQNSAKRVSKIFKDLSFANLKGFSKENLENIDLKELIEQRVEFFNSFIDEKELKVNMQLKSFKTVANKEALIRIFDNLLSNAIKYSPQKGAIDILLNNKKLIIKNSGEIKDTKEVVKKFKRENSSEGGFGLGLYIVQKICTSYGYKFNIYSKNGEVLVEVVFN